MAAVENPPKAQLCSNAQQSANPVVNGVSRTNRMLDLPQIVPKTLHWYTKQDRALQISNEYGGMFVFQRDDRKLAMRGIVAKNYTTCSLAVIRKYIYSRQNALERNVFEIVRVTNPDDTYVPCKIFIDCDLKSDECSDYATRGPRFHELFQVDMREFLVKTVDADYADAMKTPILSMDSCDAKKWSMHYIIGGIMYLNCFHVGAVVRRFREFVVEKYGHPDSPDNDNPYFYTNLVKEFIPDGIRKFFIIDLAIYTPHRAFRLLGNCKYGKKTLLIPHGASRENQYEQIFSLEEMQAHIIQDPELAETCKIYEMTEHDGSTPRSRASSRIFVGTSGGRIPRGKLISSSERALVRCGGGNAEISIPFPRTFANEICDIVHGLLPQVYLNPSGAKYRPNLMDVIISQKSTSLYCFTSQRVHSSNGNYFVFHLGRGEFKQLCFKATCVARRSTNLKHILEHSQWQITPAMTMVFREFLRREVCSLYAPVRGASIVTLFRDLHKLTPSDYNDASPEDDASEECNTDDLGAILQTALPLSAIDAMDEATV
jgi:hypothetical protein